LTSWPGSKAMPLRLAMIAGLLACVPFLPAAQLDTLRFEGVPWITVRHSSADDVRLYLFNPHGAAWKKFPRLAKALETSGDTLGFAMNAGMFHPDFRPVGLVVSGGRLQSPLNLDSASGNFFLKPNGVFWIKGRTAHISESRKYLELAIKPDLATQSGPLLLEAGKIHPRLDSLSKSLYPRNAVGIRGDSVFWAVNDSGVNLHQTARLFRDLLHCSDALFLDGHPSLWAPTASRKDSLLEMGPILAIVSHKATVPSRHPRSAPRRMRRGHQATARKP